ncbi:hypothetical protein CRUP_025581 [Coryphaenoides rupestris]|nr:hypothetical protein CRUP_025581 [Coryphaenoides rupestris]
MLVICVLRACHRCRRARPTAPKPPTHRPSNRGRDLQGIDAPAQFNITEHEAVPMRLHVVQPAPPPAPPTAWQHGAFSQLAPLPRRWGSFRRADGAVRSERQDFLGFVSFLSGLGPHPFLPVLVGVVSVAPPLVMAVEELQHRDLLDFLWRCRQEYLHSRSCIHGNVGARSVLIGGDLTAKLWGLGPAYRRTQQPVSPRELEDTEMRKWQAPEVLAGRDITQSSDTRPGQRAPATPAEGEESEEASQLLQHSFLPPAPAQFNITEHEAVPMRLHVVQPAPPPAPPTAWQHGAFSQLAPLPRRWGSFRRADGARKSSRSRCCSSSTAITRGGATETTPTSTGRKGRPRVPHRAIGPAEAAPPAGQRRQLAEGSVLPRGGRGRGRGRLDHMESSLVLPHAP